MDSTSVSSTRRGGSPSSTFLSFFSSEVFQMVLHNPTTAHRFLQFCRTQACEENIEFLQMIDQYHNRIGEVKGLIEEIRAKFLDEEAPKQINISYRITDELEANLDNALKTLLPRLETLFDKAQAHIEKLLSSDIYQRWVKHQMSISASLALGNDKSMYQGLGDSFCLTDPGKPDNPIIYASDGFVKVTGYDRREIIPRNCRFLQGALTDRSSAGRMKSAIRNLVDTVELILNYRKNGDPFWNLLYIAPLFDDRGNVVFFLGGQIDCSTTIHSNTDVLRILSLSDGPDLENVTKLMDESISTSKKTSLLTGFHTRNSINDEVKLPKQLGLEGVLVERLGRMSFKTQVEAFYTAYSKYFVLKPSSVTGALTVSHYSPGILDLLSLSRSDEQLAALFREDVFKVLGDASPSVSRAFRSIVKDNISQGKAVSVEMKLASSKDGSKKKVQDVYVSHWTPVKDEAGKPRYVVLVISPR